METSLTISVQYKDHDLAKKVSQFLFSNLINLKKKFVTGFVLVLTFFCITSSSNAQVNNLTELLNLFGVPNGFELESGYKLDTEQYYIYGEGTDLNDLNDLDLVYLNGFKSSISYGTAKNANGDYLLIQKIIDPNQEFQAWQQKVSHTLFYDGNMKTYGLSNRLISSVVVDLSDRIDFEPEDPRSGDSLILLPNGNYYLKAENFELTIDSQDLLIFVNSFMDGITMEIFEQYELNPSNDWRILQRITSIAEKSPSGSCIFYVTEENFSEYFDSMTNYLKIENPSLLTMDNKLPFKTNISPNPGRNIVEVTIEGLDIVDEIAIKIYSLTGKELFSQLGRVLDTKTIDISSLQSGVYILQVKSGDYQYTQKLIKQ